MSIADLAIKIAAADYATGVLGKVKNSIARLTEDARKLEKAGDFAGAWMKRGEAIGKGAAWGAAGLGAMLGVHSKLAKMGDAQEGFAKIQVKTGKSVEEMKAFRSKIYGIAAETGTAPERILEAALSQVSKGADDKEIFANLQNAALYAKASFSESVAGIAEGAKAVKRQMKLTDEETRKTMAGMFKVAGGAGSLGMSSMMEASQSLLASARHLGVTGAKGAVQVMAAAKFASRDMDAGAAVASVESLFSDMLAAKTEGTLAKAGINLDDLNKRAVKSGDIVGTIVAEVMAKTKGDELALSRLFKSETTRDLIRAIHAAGGEFKETWTDALDTAGGYATALELKLP